MEGIITALHLRSHHVQVCIGPCRGVYGCIGGVEGIEGVCSVEGYIAIAALYLLNPHAKVSIGHIRVCIRE